MVHGSSRERRRGGEDKTAMIESSREISKRLLEIVDWHRYSNVGHKPSFSSAILHCHFHVAYTYTTSDVPNLHPSPCLETSRQPQKFVNLFFHQRHTPPLPHSFLSSQQTPLSPSPGGAAGGISAERRHINTKQIDPFIFNDQMVARPILVWKHLV